MNLTKALLDSLNLMKTVAPIMLVSLIFANIFSPYLKHLSRPIERVFAGGFAVSAFLIHPIVGISILSKMYRQGILNFRDTAIAVAVSTFPRGLRAMIVFLFPVSVSLLGLEIGLKILALDTFSRFAIATIAVLLSGKSEERGNSHYDRNDFNILQTLKVFARTISLVFISSFIVYALIESEWRSIPLQRYCSRES